MCQYTTYLAVDSNFRQVSLCEHETVHVAIDYWSLVIGKGQVTNDKGPITND